MDIIGTQIIPAKRAAVWAALNNPEILKACLPGGESVELTAPDEFKMVMTASIGPLRAKFKGTLKMQEVDPANSCKMLFEGQGGMIGFGKGTASVALSDAPIAEDGTGAGSTQLSYSAQAHVGGKLAQVGSRLIESVAKKMTDDFFNAFNKVFTSSLAEKIVVAEEVLAAPAPLNYSTNWISAKASVSAEEWQARLDLAACYRLVDAYGMTDLVYNHITLKIPGTEHLLINLYGMLYKEMTASSLVKIDMDGNIIAMPETLEGPTSYGLNVTGYVIHGAIHKARADVNCVIHTHSRAGLAVASMKCGLLPLTQTSMRFENHIGYHDFEGPSIELDERVRLARDLGQHNAMILRNHGLLTCGPNVQQAFNNMYQLEMSCQAQVDTMAARTELNMPTPEVMALTAHLYQPATRRPYGVLEWPAMLRLLDANQKFSGFPPYNV
jgi:ribulose-5-phosphate 4-epimerase/fuculose-1-phosphate aldolase/carbon monoxide dehydrogenase subunit G